MGHPAWCPGKNVFTNTTKELMQTSMSFSSSKIQIQKCFQALETKELTVAQEYFRVIAYQIISLWVNKHLTSAMVQCTQAVAFSFFKQWCFNHILQGLIPSGLSKVVFPPRAIYIFPTYNGLLDWEIDENKFKEAALEATCKLIIHKPLRASHLKCLWLLYVRK